MRHNNHEKVLGCQTPCHKAMGYPGTETKLIKRCVHTSAVLISSKSLASFIPLPCVLVRTPSAVWNDQSSNSLLSAVLNFLNATLLGDLLLFKGDRLTLRSSNGCLFIALLARMVDLAERAPPILLLGRCGTASGSIGGRERALLGVGPTFEDTLLEKEKSTSSSSGSSPRFIGVSWACCDEGLGVAIVDAERYGSIEDF